MDDVICVWVLLLLLSVLPGPALTSQTMANMRLKKILDTGYEKRHTPVAKSSGGSVLVVSASIHIHELVLDASAMSMKIRSDVIQSWTDDRLAPVTKDTKDLPLDSEVSDLLWTPIVTIWNSREDYTLEDRHRVLLLTKNGRVIMEQRLLLDVSCSNFTGHMRPLICNVQFQLRHCTNSEVVLELEKVMPEPSFSIPGYSVAKMETGDCTRTTPTGTFSCKQLLLAFRPDVNFFATEIYGVTFLLVILSWIGFWIDGNERQASFRLGLGFVILLVMVTYGVGFRVLHSKVGVPGNVEVWLAFCILFVLASLVQFAFVHVLLRIIPRKVRHLFCRRDFREDDEDGGSFAKAVQVIDVTCGLLFPLIFILFNVVYWGTY